jgi:hypothetical protein
VSPIPLAFLANLGMLIQFSLVLLISISVLHLSKVQADEYYFRVGLYAVLVPALVFDPLAFIGYYFRGKWALVMMLIMSFVFVIFVLEPSRLPYSTLKAFGLGGDISITMYISADKYIVLPSWAKLDSSLKGYNINSNINDVGNVDLEKKRFSICKTKKVSLVLDAGSRVYFREPKPEVLSDEEIITKLMFWKPLSGGGYISLSKDSISLIERLY